MTFRLQPPNGGEPSERSAPPGPGATTGVSGPSRSTVDRRARMVTVFGGDGEAGTPLAAPGRAPTTANPGAAPPTPTARNPPHGRQGRGTAPLTP